MIWLGLTQDSLPQRTRTVTGRVPYLSLHMSLRMLIWISSLSWPRTLILGVCLLRLPCVPSHPQHSFGPRRRSRLFTLAMKPGANNALLYN
jgi:hypothetical protein